MMFFELFYRKYGVRKPGQLLSPPLTALAELELPREAILHYPGVSNLETGPAPDEFLFRNITRQIMVTHVTELSSTKGFPKRNAVPVDQRIRQWHATNRRYRRALTIEQGTRDKLTPYVVNYALLHSMFRYIRSMFAEYNAWYNLETTVWDNIARLAVEAPERQQFLMVRLPQLLPSISKLRQAEGVETALEAFGGDNVHSLESLADTSNLGMVANVAFEELSQSLLKHFNTPELLLILELWKWCGDVRETSMIDRVKGDALSKVNLVFQESGRWVVLNLGALNGWRVGSESNTGAKGLEPKQVQNRFLRFLMAVFDLRTAATLANAPIAPDAQNATTTVTVVTQGPQVTETSPDGSVATVQSNEIGSVALPEVVSPDGGDIFVKLDKLKFSKSEEEAIEKDLLELEQLMLAKTADEQSAIEKGIYSTVPIPSEDGVKRVCNLLADDGLLSPAEYRRHIELSKSYYNLPAPDGKGSLAEFIKIPPEALAITDDMPDSDLSGVVDKGMLKSSLVSFDEKYIKHVMAKDVAAMVINLQNAGLSVTSYESTRVETITGAYDDVSVRMVPVIGAASTVRFKIPAMETDGTFKSNGVKYRLRKQRGDVPIRKVSPDTVALTSYYGKTFVNRSDKRVNNYSRWLCNQIMALGLDPNGEAILHVHPANVFDKAFKAPRLYTTIASTFKSFDLRGFTCHFDHTARGKIFPAAAIAAYEVDGSILVGINPEGNYLLMGANDAMYLAPAKIGALEELPSFEEMAAIPSLDAPVDFAVVTVLGKSIPLGVALGYEMGLDALIRLLRVNPRRVPAGTRLALEPNEFPIQFSDETLVFSKDDKLASMILAGFNEYRKSIKEYGVYDFDKRAVYFNVLEAAQLTPRFLRELDLMQRLFVDPITRDILIEMQEPVEFTGLLMKSASMLLHDNHPAELDGRFMRVRGYERISGSVYSEIVRAVRTQGGSSGKSRNPVDVNPYAVWRNITQDGSLSLVSDINPIENLKQAEAVTYAGTGGRNSRSMVRGNRAYGEHDIGTISEATVDSSDVGINIATSANPMFTSLRGMSKPMDLDNPDVTSLLSSAALVSVGSTRDDPKRTVFTGIQHSHTVSCKGYKQSQVRTGYEQVMARRTSDLFATVARKEGKVTGLTETGIVITYADGETHGIELGRRFGAAAGLTIPHDLTTDLMLGAKVKPGTVVAYNTGFFERDYMNPDNVVWKAGTTVKVALMESNITIEDSSGISKRVAETLATAVTKTRIIVVSFDQEVHQLVKGHTHVESEDILCLIEDAITASSGQFDKESLDTLRILSAQAPQAKSNGIVEKVEVYYHGEKEDMSNTIRNIVNASDREFARIAKSANKPVFTGSVDEGFRVDGNPLALDTIAIKIYITHDVAAGVGDKGVFANQMKTVFGKVLPNDIVTEDGTPIDAIFGYKSIQARIVTSPILIGTTTTLLKVIAQKAVEIYDK